jgi:pimeloyl-ACP methyl ester carboxylesterase
LQLPPDYHHQRSYPVLMVCHNGRESAEAMMKRVSEEAARNGVILVAPEWSGKKGLGGAKYTYGREHDLVLDTLRDLRRRLQIDSDRVFLFGLGEGANMAFDIGLAHPDQFAGVIPMCGSVTKFARKWYWPNAQYLPFYIVEGQANQGHVAAMNDLMQEWGRSPFSTIYMEYQGRASEWFGAEMPMIFKWMSCQKRTTPLKALGRMDLKGGIGEGFRSSRASDTRFYWLSAETIDSACVHSHTAAPAFKYLPASFQANLSLGNQLKNGKAVIWNRAIIRTNGLKNVTLWITPGVDMMDLTKPIELIVNGQERAGMLEVAPSLETLLEELSQSSDRQRLFVAKIDIRIK